MYGRWWHDYLEWLIQLSRVRWMIVDAGEAMSRARSRCTHVVKFHLHVALWKFSDDQYFFGSYFGSIIHSFQIEISSKEKEALSQDTFSLRELKEP